DVYVAHGGRTPCAAWGEILTSAARANGDVGAVIDGYHSDTKKMLDQDFPDFSRGAYGADAGARSSVVDFDVPIEIGHVRVHPGDLIVGDDDGVIVVPKELEGAVLESALAKVKTENRVRIEIENGMSATEAFERFGVL